jgi:hypothetical protein
MNANIVGKNLEDCMNKLELTFFNVFIVAKQFNNFMYSISRS